jgi:replicative DNA helicase
MSIHNIEAEQAIIGAILDVPEWIEQLPQSLKPEHFYDSAHQMIFKAAQELFVSPFGLTALTLKQHLSKMPKLGDMEPLEYLKQVMQTYADLRETGAFSEKGIPGMAEAITDAYKRRKLQHDINKDLALLSDVGAPLKKTADTMLETLLSVDMEDNTGTKNAAEISEQRVAETLKLVDADKPRGIAANLRAWNDVVGPMLPGDLIVVGGATSMGKTALVQQIAYEIAAGNAVLAFSMEMTRQQWMDRYFSQLTRIPTERLEIGPLSKTEHTQIAIAGDNLKASKLILCDRNRLTVRGMMGIVRAYKRKAKIELVVIDHLQFIEHPDPKVSGPQKISDITRDLKAMAKELDLPVILISHLNRDLASREGKRPQLSDLFGSSAIEKDADCVLFVHRDHYWLSRSGPRPPDDPYDTSEEEANRMKWEAALERTKNEADLILAKRRRGKGSAWKKVRFEPEITLFADQLPPPPKAPVKDEVLPPWPD